MPAPTDEAVGGVAEANTNDPGTDPLPEEKVPAPRHGGDLGEKKEVERPELSNEGLATSCHGGIKSDVSEEEGASTGGRTSDHGDGQAEAKEADPNDLRNMIENGQEGRLRQLLRDEERREELLTQTYGGNANDESVDTNGLYRETSPLLHAARRGQADMVRVLLWFLKETPELRLQQLAAKDGGGRTALQLAALSGDRYTFEVVLDACKEEPNPERIQLLEMLTSSDTATGSTVLMAAACSGDYFTCQKALKATRDALDKAETKLKEELLKKDKWNRTLLHLAAKNGNRRPTSFRGDTVLYEMLDACTKEGLTTKTLLEMLTSKDTASESTVLMTAASSGCELTFHAALEATRTALDKDKAKLREHLLEKDNQHQALLQLAALTGSQSFFDAVWDACTELGVKAQEMCSRQDFRIGGTTGLMAVAESKDWARFERELREAMELNDAETLGGIISSKNIISETLLSKAVHSGDAHLFKVVWKGACDVLSPHQREALVESKNIFGESCLTKAFDEGNEELFEAVLDCVWILDPHQLPEFIYSDTDAVVSPASSNSNILSRVLLRRAVETLDVAVFEAATTYVVRRYGFFGHTTNRCRRSPIWSFNFRNNGYNILQKLPSVMDFSSLGRKVAERRSSKMDTIFADAKITSLGNHEDHTDDLKLLSSLIANSARPSVSDLKELSQVYASEDMFKRCCLQAVTSAANPFIPGITLSIRLGEAAKQASEGERRKIMDTKSSIEELLLEIFERLPQTVRGFEEQAGTDSCAGVLEPEAMRAKSGSNDFLGGPLDMIISERQQLETFCKVPLVMDFLSSKFTLGLPDVIDTARVLKNGDQLSYLDDNGLLNFDGNGVDELLQGVHVPSWTFLPGAQFIVAGVLAAPTNYYKVPAVRMLLDFVVYIGMVAALSYFVLFHSTTGNVPGDDGIVDHRFSSAECACALVFITTGIYREWREMNRGIGGYFKDQWNVLDALGILCLFVGLVIRWNDWTSPWGPAFYALSAPLVVSRVLFFAQILQFQGPMIQVIFRMAATLLQFGAVMLVVMIGFTMALHVLFRDLEDFGGTLLSLFKAMLGDTDIFDNFSGGRYDDVATMLMVVYLFIVTIMLLNLLIAILSTSHAQVQENTGGAFKVSKARIIAHYRMVVDKNVLPAPFNLVQLLLSLGVCVFASPYYFFLETKKERRANERRAQDVHGLIFWGDVCEGVRRRQQRSCQAFGLVVFWLVLGPVAVAGGTILWGLSGLSYAQYVEYSTDQFGGKYDQREEVGVNDRRVSPRVRLLQGRNIVLKRFRAWVRTVRVFFYILLWCILGAPCCLFLRWLTPPVVEVVSWCRQLATCCPRKNSDEGRESSKRARTPTIESMLKKTPGGVGADKLREFLEDPMNDKDVRQDEKDRKTTVEHMKRLRDRLERTNEMRLKELGNNMASKEELKVEVRNIVKSELEEVLERLEASSESKQLRNTFASKSEVNNNTGNDVANCKKAWKRYWLPCSN